MNASHYGDRACILEFDFNCWETRRYADNATDVRGAVGGALGTTTAISGDTYLLAQSASLSPSTLETKTLKNIHA